MNELVNRTVKSGLVDLLREEIVRGDLKPGQRLRLEEIASRFGVSTMPVREALRDLESEGLVEVFPHRGSVVTEYSPEDLQDIYDLRAFLEEKATRAAVPHMNEEDLKKLENLIIEMDENFDDVFVEVELNHEFHGTLYAPSNRKHLNELNHSLRYKSQHYLRSFISDLGGMSRAQVEHRAIVEACRQGDAEQAAKLVYDHVAKVGHAIVAYLEKQQQAAS